MIVFTFLFAHISYAGAFHCQDSLSGVFVTIDEPALIYQNYPASIVYLTFTLGVGYIHRFYGFRQMNNDIHPSL
jgi:hypothetical protein